MHLPLVTKTCNKNEVPCEYAYIRVKHEYNLSAHRGQCYDFKNIFDQKNGAILTQNTAFE
jgi:hypothetical protein